MCGLNVEGGVCVAEDLGINPGQTLCGAGVKFQQNSGVYLHCFHINSKEFVSLEEMWVRPL